MGNCLYCNIIKHRRRYRCTGTGKKVAPGHQSSLHCTYVYGWLQMTLRNINLHFWPFELNLIIKSLKYKIDLESISFTHEF